jgi:serine-type D-Ala-D-Ala carboxypeptidase/endopeptidase (penicillin-binding protein 4)
MTVFVLAAGTAAYAVTHGVRGHDVAAATPTPGPTAPVLGVLPAPPSPAPNPSDGPIPGAAGVSAALAGPLADARLGGRVLAEVRDVRTGSVLMDESAATPAAPASTAKIATAVAVLTALRPTDRITTQVVAGDTPGEIVLVGAGDPTLTAASAGAAGAYPEAARVSDLAAAVRASRVTVARVAVDTSRFSGPLVGPGWAPGDAPSAYAAPITAALVDGGRDTPSASTRSADPAAAAGRSLAADLGLPASAVIAGRASAGGRVLAAVRSAPISTLVEQMLRESDNVLAECLARQVALAAHQPASFAGAAAATAATLRGVGVDIGAGLLDGSGLSPNDRIAPATVAALLLAAVGGTRPALRDVVASLSVAAWDGTLEDRFSGGPGAGIVRGKTGTLTGVSALAGVLRDREGRLLLFSLVADRVPAGGTDAAEQALDAAAVALVSCGCH